MVITDNDILELAESLLRTCKSLDDELEQSLSVTLDEVSLHMLEILDNEVICCETCGWWVETSEATDGECEDCYEQ
jgi:hypothetical protein